jgi:sugar-specific transcriptional regulator TrmB
MTASQIRSITDTYSLRCNKIVARTRKTPAKMSNATTSGVPRTKVYDALRRLGEEKWVTVEQGRPRLYSPRYPKDVFEERVALLSSELDYCSNELTLLYDRQIGKETYHFSLIRGVDNISAKVLEMIGRARQSLIMMGSTFPFSQSEIKRLTKKIIKAKRMDVTVRLVSSPEIWLKSEKIDVRAAFQSLVSDIRLFPPPPDDAHPASWISLYVDRKEALQMIAMVEAGVPDLQSATAMWIPNATWAQYTLNMLDFDGLWEKLEPI